MARRAAARERRRGGEEATAPRPSRARVGSALAALALAAALAAYPVASAPRLEGLFAGLGGAGVLALAAALAGAPRAMLPSLLLLAGAYGGSLFARGKAIDLAAPLVATGLLVTAELAFWSLDLRLPERVERAAQERRAAEVLTLALATPGLAAAVLAVGLVPVAGSVALEAGGVACSLGLLALLARLAARGRG